MLTNSLVSGITKSQVFLKIEVMFNFNIFLVLASGSDCNNLKSFANGLMMGSANPTIMAALNSINCCTAQGITCSGQTVTSIIWNNLGLSGTILNAYMAVGLTYLDLSNNQVMGTGLTFPTGLLYLNVNSNSITSITSYPSSLTHLDIGNNTIPEGVAVPSSVTYYDASFTGRSGSLSSGLIRQYTDLSGNSYSNSAPSIPVGTLHLNLNGNSFTGSVPSLPSGLTFLNVGGCTLFSGSFPILPSSLTYLDMSSTNVISIPTLVNGLTYLDISNNGFTGTFPSLPSVLLTFAASNNAFTGSIPALPQGLQVLKLHGNAMSGNLPIFPSSLSILYLGYPRVSGNHFTGTVVLNKPTQLFINSNFIADVQITDSSLFIGTFVCDLSDNPLLGNPNIAGLTKCTKNGLYAAPVTISVSKTSFSSFSTTTLKQTTKPSTISTTTSFTKSTTSSSLQTTISTISKQPSVTKSTHIESTDSPLAESQTSEIETMPDVYKPMIPTTTKQPKTKTTKTAIVSTIVIISNEFSLISILVMGIKLIINLTIVVKVISSAPFKREWIKKNQKPEESTY